MNESTNHLVDALREELKQYGEMLALLDQQQQCVFERLTEDLLQTTDAINRQTAIIEATRRERAQRQRTLARSVGLPEDAGFSLLSPVLPAAYRPLVQALVEENNDLLQRIQHRGRQNHLLLSRAVELMQRFMGALFPAAGATTYNGNGSLISPTRPITAVLEAVG